MTDKTEADTVADEIAVPFVRKPLSEQETNQGDKTTGAAAGATKGVG